MLKRETFNVASGQQTSARRLAEALGESLLPLRQGEVRFSQADVSRAQRVLGWRARVELEAELARTALSLKVYTRRKTC